MQRLRQEGALLLALALMVALMNAPFGVYVLYPFALFSTWIHELCHGLVALVLGGSIERIQVFPDTSGLAFTRRPVGRLPTGLVASAGYVGTAVAGALLLSLRHRRWVGPIGVPVIGGAMLLSAILWIRNPFGVAAIVVVGAVLAVLGRVLARGVAHWLFTFLAATCCLNSITSVRALFASVQLLDGNPTASSDAHTVAQAWLLPYWFWASLWLVSAVLLTGTGIALGSPPARTAAPDAAP